MRDKFHGLVGEDDGGRFSMAGTYQGFRAVAVTGYDARSDSWPVHVLLQPPGEKMRRLTGLPATNAGPSKEDAIDLGFEIAKSEIERLGRGTALQTSVPMEPPRY